MNSPTLNPEDTERLASQLNRVESLMSDGNFRTLREIAEAVKGSEAGVSARLRQLRNDFGMVVNRERCGNGLYVYQVLPPVQASEYKFGSDGQAFFL